MRFSSSHLALLAAGSLLITACGGKVAVDGTPSTATGGSGGAGGNGGAGGGPVCVDIPALCAAYCDSFAAQGCADPLCLGDCEGAFFLGSPPECRDAMIAAVACSVGKPMSCGTNFSPECGDEQSKLFTCWDLSQPCNGYLCGPCGCENSGCTTSYATECHGVEDGVECDCLRDGELLGSCIEGGSCPDQLPGCCASYFFDQCGG